MHKNSHFAKRRNRTSFATPYWSTHAVSGRLNNRLAHCRHRLQRTHTYLWWPILLRMVQPALLPLPPPLPSRQEWPRYHHCQRTAVVMAKQAVQLQRTQAAQISNLKDELKVHKDQLKHHLDEIRALLDCHLCQADPNR